MKVLPIEFDGSSGLLVVLLPLFLCGDTFLYFFCWASLIACTVVLGAFDFRFSLRLRLLVGMPVVGLGQVNVFSLVGGFWR